MMRGASIVLVLLVALFILGARTVALGQERPPFKGLIAAAPAVVAVEILSTDYTATPADGPMVAAAKILKVLKGPLTSGKEFRFSETAWVGPTYQKGDYRILFLEKAASSEFPRPTDWRILSRLDARTDFFIEKDSLSDLSLESLEAFLKRIEESKDTRKKTVFGKGTVK
jgi:hypothetical protein